MTKYLKRKCLFQNEAAAQTGLHFEAFYVSWISLEKIYFMKQVGKILLHNRYFAVIINVEGTVVWLKE
jgi:hypothetical protein